MSPKKKRTTHGVITFHTPFPAKLLKSEGGTADLKDPAETIRSPSQQRSPFKSEKAKQSESSSSGSQLSPTQNLLSHSSLRQLQVKMETENHLVKKILETENGFMKDLEKFFRHRDVNELRRRELLHKRWTERVWFPLQRRVEERVSRCSPVDAERRQRLYSHYLQHCNTKGFVFLETYDLKEYDPFLLNTKQPRFFKLSAADFQDPFYLHERLKDQKEARCEAGCKQKRPQSDHPPAQPAAPHHDIYHLVSSSYQSSASRKTTTTEDVTRGRKSSRLDAIPCHILASAAADGRCNQQGCCSSRRGRHQQSASSQQLQSTCE
ncbi:protein FAM228A [Xyrichtys novacula]|uniref:Protein FAM228A n=1 Tax=Xyrichtys novacula TaxID=13765 RepID=A0AAV1GV49_XYRNO|nr:protein FAM228A [Xyrichtys novacula]